MTYTGLSNLFIGLACLLCGIYRLVKRNNVLPKWLFIVKVVLLTQVTITFLITATYLAPNLGADWWKLYNNASLFNHFITPVTVIVGFVFFEKKVETKWKDSLFAPIPIAAYCVMYVINVYTHLNPDGSTNLAYDIYGFFRYGVGIFILFLLFFFSLAFGLSFLYCFIIKRKKS